MISRRDFSRAATGKRWNRPAFFAFLDHFLKEAGFDIFAAQIHARHLPTLKTDIPCSFASIGKLDQTREQVDCFDRT